MFRVIKAYCGGQFSSCNSLRETLKVSRRHWDSCGGTHFSYLPTLGCWSHIQGDIDSVGKWLKLSKKVSLRSSQGKHKLLHGAPQGWGTGPRSSHEKLSWLLARHSCRLTAIEMNLAQVAEVLNCVLSRLEMPLEVPWLCLLDLGHWVGFRLV